MKYKQMAASFAVPAAKSVPKKAAAPTKRRVQTKLDVRPVSAHFDPEVDSAARNVMIAGDKPIAVPSTIMPLPAQRASHSKTQSKRKSSAKKKAPPKAPPVIQSKLDVGPVGDYFEREADSVARRVMSGGDAPFAIPPAITPLTTQRDAQSGVTGSVQLGAVPASVERSIARMQSGPASQMDGRTKSFMENRLGRDFSGVRVHKDGDAQLAAQSLGANAFTVGNDIFFNKGRYQPESNTGRTLIAHELTHTAQQARIIGTAARKLIQRDEGSGPFKSEITISNKKLPKALYTLAGKFIRFVPDDAPTLSDMELLPEGEYENFWGKRIPKPKPDPAKESSSEKESSESESSSLITDEESGLSLPRLSPEDTSLYIEKGFAYRAYEDALQASSDSNNSTGQRVASWGLAFLAAPLAWGEEYIGRSAMNVPHNVLNNSIKAAERAARAKILSQRGQNLEAWVEGLHAVAHTSVSVFDSLSIFAGSSSKVPKVNGPKSVAPKTASPSPPPGKPSAQGKPKGPSDSKSTVHSDKYWSDFPKDVRIGKVREHSFKTAERHKRQFDDAYKGTFGNQPPVSLLSKIYANPKSFPGIKIRASNALKSGNFEWLNNGGLNVFVDTPVPAGWVRGKERFKLELRFRAKGSWHHFPSLR